MSPSQHSEENPVYLQHAKCTKAVQFNLVIPLPTCMLSHQSLEGAKTLNWYIFCAKPWTKLMYSATFTKDVFLCNQLGIILTNHWFFFLIGTNKIKLIENNPVSKFLSFFITLKDNCAMLIKLLLCLRRSVGF